MKVEVKKTKKGWMKKRKKGEKEPKSVNSIRYASGRQTFSVRSEWGIQYYFLPVNEMGR